MSSEVSVDEMFKHLDFMKKKFRLSCSIIVRFNNVVKDCSIRYKRARQDGMRPCIFNLRNKVLVYEGVRKMFHQYAMNLAEELDQLKVEIMVRGLDLDSSDDDYSDDDSSDEWPESDDDDDDDSANQSTPVVSDTD